MAIANLNDINDKTILINRKGERVFTKFEYLLDILETNLLCYKTDFFRNDEKFGVPGVDLTDKNSLYDAISNIIKDRCGNLLTLSQVTDDGGTLKVQLSYTEAKDEGELTIDKNNKLISIYKKGS